MRNIIANILAFIAVTIAANGQTQVDSVKVYFDINRALFNSAIGENALSMDSFLDKVRAAAESGELDHVEIRGYASPDGSLKVNEHLALKRCESIAAYMIEHTGIDPDRVNTLSGGVAWDELRSLVEVNDKVPRRSRVLEILNDDSLKGRDSNGVDLRKRSLKALDGGKTYRWLLLNLFPKLRYSSAISLFIKSEICDSDTPTCEEIPVNEDVIICEEVPAQDDNCEIVDAEETVEPTEEEALTETVSTTGQHYILALKTNMLYYGALLPNIELEWLINDNWSVALEGNLAWWGSYSRNKSYRLAIIDAEVRRWIKPRQPWHGFYVGAFAGGGWYDFLNSSTTGYRGEGGMAGISAGYMWPIRHNLSLEAGLGAGYLYTRYKEYMPYEGHHLYQRTKTLSYFGPLKVKFSIVWRFLDKNKKRSIPNL